ncbi:hypothetical protein [Mycobacterium paraffinicum]|uniref:hypothetical protein n=1 Tax=Mycobacterium paraffinicum TaxID=53378 RepID=UPI001ABFC132|nr:hypothetical protein [Mycobacterium paraffinicum]
MNDANRREQRRDYYERNRAYLSRMNRRRRDRLKKLVENPNRGPYSEHEINVLVREDISLKEMACLTRRSYESVMSKRVQLRKVGILR